MFKLLFMVSFALADLKVGVLTSSTTSAEYISELHHNLWSLSGYLESSLSLSFKVSFDWETVPVTDQESTWSIPSSLSGFQVLIDATNDLAYGQFLASRASADGFLHCVAGRGINSLYGEDAGASSLYLESSAESEALAFVDLVAHFGWVNLGLVYDNESRNQDLSKLFKKNYSNAQIRDEVLLSRDDLQLSENLSSRLDSTSKISDARIFLVMTEPALAAIALYAADISALGSSGHAWLLSTQAMENIGEVARSSHADESSELFGVLKTGALGFMVNQDNSPLASVRNTLVLIARAYNELGIDTAVASIRSNVLSNAFNGMSFDTSGVRYTQYELYNVQDFVETKVGYHDANNRSIVLESNSIIWPGFDTSPPNDQVPVVKLVLLYPLHDENGVEFADGVQIRMGFDLAIEKINRDSTLLQGYILEPVYKDTYRSSSLVSVNVKSLANINILGYVGPFDSDISREYLDLLNTQVDPKPMVSYSASAYYLNATDFYPRFLRVIQPDGLEAVAVTRFIQQESLKKIGVIYTDDSYGMGVYQSLIGNIESFGIEIINDESKRAVSYKGVIDDNTLADIETVLGNIVENQVKIIVYLGNKLLTPEIAKVAYQKELYGEDYAWIGTIWIDEDTLELIATDYSDFEDEIYEVLEGSVGLGYLPPSDTLGEEFSSEFMTRWNTNYTTYSMYAYDSVYLFATIVNGMITRGEDFNGGNELISNLRAADFDAASGKIKFTDSTNDRSGFGYSVLNMQSRNLVKVWVYDPLDPLLFLLEPGATMQWNGSSKPSYEWPEEEQINCPFALHMRTISVEGLSVIICIGLFLFAMTLLLSYFSYKKWKQVDIKIIDDDVMRSWKDSLVQITIAIEFFQFVAIAPRFSSLEIIVEIASNLFMLDVIKIAQGDQSSYWNLLIAICILCYLWFVLVVLIMFNIEKWVKGVPICQRVLTLFNAAYLPFVGNTMFLPFTALLLDCLVCDYQAQGKAVVRRDCYMNCWTEEHISYVIMSVVALAVYQPIAAYSRPLWQQARSGLNLMAKPSFLLFKTCVQILLIAVGKSLRGVSPIAHGVVFSLLSMAFAGLTYKFQPFNYERCNLYEVSSLIAVTYLSILATISFEADPTHYGWFVALCVGWGLIAGSTYIIQIKLDKYKDRLKTHGIKKKSMKIRSMVTFNTQQYKQYNNDSTAFEFYGKNPSPAEISAFDFDESQDSAMGRISQDFGRNFEEKKESRK